MNKLKFKLFAIALTLFLFTAAESKAQTKQPVRFAKGSTSTEVRGKIINGKTVSYLVGAKAGQTISVEVTDGGKNNDVVFEVIAPDGNRLGGGDRMYDKWNGKLRKSGNYVLWVSTMETQNTDFKLRVSIR